MTDDARHAGPRGKSSSGLRPSPRQLGALILAAIAVVFIVQNRSRVHIHFLTAEFSCPMWLLLLIMTLLGMGIGLGLVRWRRRRKARRAG